jgi:hypothetical protein
VFIEIKVALYAPPCQIKFVKPSDAHTKIALAAVSCRTALEEIEIGNLLEAYNYAASAKNDLQAAMSFLTEIVAEIPDKEFAIEL